MFFVLQDGQRASLGFGEVDRPIRRAGFDPPDRKLQAGFLQQLAARAGRDRFTGLPRAPALDDRVLPVAAAERS